MADKSALLTWKKIQSVPNGDDIAEALRCEVRDPLWFLARQWQLGEFKAEDAGMAAYAHLVGQSTPLQRYTPAGQSPQPLPTTAPLNSTVERIAPAFDLNWRIETGHIWRRMLQQSGKAATWDIFRQNPLLHFKSVTPAFEPEKAEMLATSHKPYTQMMAACANGRAIDGERLFNLIENKKASDFLNTPDPVVDDLGKKWVIRVREQLGVQSNCWDPERLEYRFESAAALPGGAAVCLNTPEYNGQALGWQDFVQSAGNPALQKDLDPTLAIEHRRTLIPSRVSFPGMPRARWWEIEDSTIDLSNVKAAKTDTGVLLLAEFCLLYSNDWLLIPLSVPVGHLVNIRNIKVTDVFGVQSVIGSALNTASPGQWGMFQMAEIATPKGWLYIPPTANSLQQSPAVEEVHFIRDEMANMVWAVEKTVPDGLGEGIDGQSTATRTEEWLRQLANAPVGMPPDTQQNEAALQYVLGTTVPPHWIPFIPFRPDATKVAEMVLRRAAMPRLIDGQTPTRIRPRTQILRNANYTVGTYDIQEEEIPVMGLTVRSVWRRARWFGGRTFTWLAREKTLGRHLESSGLRFDQIADKT